VQATAARLSQESAAAGDMIDRYCDGRDERGRDAMPRDVCHKNAGIVLGGDTEGITDSAQGWVWRQSVPCDL